MISGEIDGYFATVGLTQTVKENPKVKILATTASPGGKSFFAGVKTFHELGVKNMVFNTLYGLAIRSSTPENVKIKLTQAVIKVVHSEEMKKARALLTLEDYSGTTEDYKKDVQNTLKLYQEAMAATSKTGN